MVILTPWTARQGWRSRPHQPAVARSARVGCSIRLPLGRRASTPPRVLAVGVVAAAPGAPSAGRARPRRCTGDGPGRTARVRKDLWRAVPRHCTTPGVRPSTTGAPAMFCMRVGSRQCNFVEWAHKPTVASSGLLMQCFFMDRPWFPRPFDTILRDYRWGVPGKARGHHVHKLLWIVVTSFGPGSTP